MKKCVRAAAAALVLLFSACTVGSGSPIRYSAAPIPNTTSSASFDAIEIDQAASRLYVADRADSGVDVFDLSTVPATYAKTISFSFSPNGLAFAPDLKRLYVGLGNGSLGIVDVNLTSPTAYSVIKVVPTGGKTVDLIDYSQQRHEVYASNGSDGTVTKVDANTGAVTGQMKIGFGLEQPRFNPADGLVYVTSPDAGAMFVLDPNTGTVNKKIGIGSCLGKGFAINPKLDQAMIACSTWVQRINLRNTSDLEVFKDIGGGDLVTYDAAADRFLVAAPDDVPAAVGIFGGNPIRYIAKARAPGHGNSAALDEQHGTVYTPDTRAGKAGLMAFDLPNGEPPISIDSSALVEIGAAIAVIVLVMLWIGRHSDPVNRPAPLPRRRRA